MVTARLPRGPRVRACENRRVPIDIDDPRTADTGGATDAPPAVAEALRALAAAGEAARDRHVRAIDAALDAALADVDGGSLARLFDAAPPGAVYRLLWRRLGARMARPIALGDGLAVALFALPIAIVAAREADAAMPAAWATSIADAAKIVSLLRDHGALGERRELTLGNVLVPAAALGVEALPRVRAAARTLLAPSAHALDLAPSAIAPGPREGVHLRFLVGGALCAPDAPALASGSVGSWATPLARQLSRELAAPGVDVLALPRAPGSLPHALATGRVAQREVAAQLFVSNALRRMRASVGEPVATISAHRLASGGELRLSLASPFAPRDAEGYRCPLFPFERVDDAATMLDDLLRDCRVADVRVERGVHGDRHVDTGLPLLFKPPSRE
jgi:hypothetical protein